MESKVLMGDVARDLRIMSELVRTLEQILESRDVSPRDTPDYVWSDFAAQDPQLRAMTIKNLSEYLQVLQYAEAQVPSNKDEKKLAWHVIKYLGLVPPDNLFDYIKDGDFIEIYNVAGIQVYRNLEFCRIVSYSIAEMSVYRWDELYSRDPAITNLIITNAIQKGFSGTRDLFKIDVPKHPVFEVFGGRNGEYTTEFNYLCPLVNKASKGVDHILATSQVIPISRNRNKTA